MTKQKVLFITANIFITLLIAVSSLVVYERFYNKIPKNNEDGKYNGLEKYLTTTEKEITFYKNLNNYKYLLGKEDLKTLDKTLNEFEINKENEDLFILFSTFLLKKDPSMTAIFDKIKKEVNSKKTVYTKSDEDNNFNKNNSCIDLSKSLSDKLPKDEKFNFIFYSPTTKSCLYVSTEKYRHQGGYFDEKSYGYDTLKVYNSVSQSNVGSYLIAYSYDYPNKSKEDIENETNNNKANFVKYILENSNYNADLFKDMSFVYSY